MTKDFDERNAEKSRKVCAAMAEAADTDRRNLSERERQILGMWPKYEDGEYVWFGDSVEHDGTTETVQGFKLYRCGPAFLSVVGVDTEKWLRIKDYESVKRPVQSVLDADGVEIKVGDTVWHEDGSEWIVEEMNRYGARCFDGDRRRTFDPRCLTHISAEPKVMDADGVPIRKGDTVWYRCLCTMGSTRKATVTGFDDRDLDVKLATLKDEAGKTWYIDPKKITHTNPDSWERLEEDVNTIVTVSGMYHRLNDYCNKRDLGGDDVMVLTVCDIVRRVRALAGAEAGR